MPNSIESIFSPEKTERCDLPVVSPIPGLPDIVECNMGPIPTFSSLFPVLPPKDGCDGTDGQDGTDGTDGQDGRDGQDGIGNFYVSFLREPYLQGQPLAAVQNPSKVEDGEEGSEPLLIYVPYSQIRCDVPAGTPLRFYTDTNTTYKVDDFETDYVLLDIGVNCGSEPIVLPKQELECEIIEPVRCPRFYDKNVSPNPMAIAPDGFFLPKDAIPYDNGFNAYMSMGLVKLMGKEYSPLPATYYGGERVLFWENGTPLGMGVAQQGMQRVDERGKPLFLMRRRLKTTDSNCTVRRGRDTSYPFKWEYVDGTEFSSGVNDYLGGTFLHAFSNIEQDHVTYPVMLYQVDPHLLSLGYFAHDDADTVDLRNEDYFEMKPYYAFSSVETEFSREEVGVSPQWWKRTMDPSEAQLNYDFGYCPDLEWAESLIPGEKVKCVEKLVVFDIVATDNYGNPVYAYLRDDLGEVVLDDWGNPVPVLVKKLSVFRYYELIPPELYRTATEGQPDVELYTGTEETLRLTDSLSGSVDVAVAITSLEREEDYVPPEDVILPDYSLVYVALRENSAHPELINPLAVVNDLQKNRNGQFVQRLRALWYKKDKEDRKYPMLFEVDALRYGHCIEAGNIQHFFSTELDQCAPHYLLELYTVNRADRVKGQKGKTLQLAPTKCFKHRLQVPVLPR